MKRRIRKRRVLKWIGVGSCVVLGAGWLLNFLWGVLYVGSEWSFVYAGGALGIGFGDFRFNIWNLDEPTTAADWIVDEFEGVLIWWPKIEQLGPTEVVIIIPIWVFLLLTTISTIWLWRSDHCPKGGCMICAYNLTGNVSGVCPECGMPIKSIGAP